MATLSEVYRPTDWSSVVGQQEVKRKLRLLAKGGLAGRAYWLTGASGIGKTTMARLLAKAVADPFSVEEFDGADLTMDRLRDIERQEYTSRPIGGKCWCFIANEAHKLRGPIVSRLLTALDPIPDHVMWVFTTTLAGGVLFDKTFDAAPFLSRCVKLELADDEASRIERARRAMEIAALEGLDGRPLRHYIGLIGRHRGNLRSALNEIESGAMLAEVKS